MSWEIEFAKELKNKENITPMGVIEGVVLSLNPLRVAIKDGKIILEKEQIHVSRSLLTKNFTSFGTGKIKLTGSGIGSITLNGVTQNTDSLDWKNVNIEFEITYDETYNLKVNEKVYVIPTTSEQIYFICDVIEEKG